jgi:5,6-dimethylbenzimidazole synthase
MTNITEDERKVFYKVLHSRRDVRSEFLQKPIPEDVLSRILKAAHHAPSVGFMQPWDIIIIEDQSKKEELKQAFIKSNNKVADLFEKDKKKLYKSLKLEGILEAPIGVIITCDKNRTGPVVIGRTTNPEMDVYSSVCAVQNLWLAARAENIGVGWVSIFENDDLKRIFNIPEDIIPIAYLCMGYVSDFHEKPELEKVGWLPRMDVNELIHYNTWEDKNESK